MIKLIYVFSLVIFLFSACSTVNKSECENLVCTEEFRMVEVKFIDASGNPVSVKDFAAINKRTGESTVQNNEPATINNRGNYIVASDADVKKLSEAGDVINVSATHPISNKKIEAEFVISGGICACHISQISGPAIMTF